MQQIKMLAPTIFDALQALEKSCRKQDDPHFRFEMPFYLSIFNQITYGCVATATLMQLTGKTGKDFISLNTTRDSIQHIDEADRARAYGIAIETDTVENSAFRQFEKAIDALRESNLLPLLEFYQLKDHINAPQAVDWLYANQPFDLGFGTNNSDLNRYATFLESSFIPLMQSWFATSN